MYVITENNKVVVYPASLSQIRKQYPNTSFPSQPSHAELAEFEIYPVGQSEQPKINHDTSYLEEGTPVKTAAGWVKVWEVKDLSSERQAEIAAAKVTNARATRNRLLSETDYLALSDGTLTDAMKTYRQALRDVPAQSGFPDNITWPTKPS